MPSEHRFRTSLLHRHEGAPYCPYGRTDRKQCIMIRSTSDANSSKFVNRRTGATATRFHTCAAQGRPVVGLSRRCSNAEDRAKLDCRSLSALARADTSCTLSTWQGLPMHKLGAPPAARRCPPPGPNSRPAHGSRFMMQLLGLIQLFAFIRSSACRGKHLECCWVQQSWLMRFAVFLPVSPRQIHGSGRCGPL